VRTPDRHRLVRRLDTLFFVGLLVTSGLAALLFWTQFYLDQEDVDAAPRSTSTAAALGVTATRTPPPPTPTASLTNTVMPLPPTLTDTRTPVPPTWTASPTNTVTPVPPTWTASPTDTVTAIPPTWTPDSAAMEAALSPEPDDSTAATATATEPDRGPATEEASISVGGTPVALLQGTRTPTGTAQPGAAGVTPPPLPGVTVSRPVTLSGKTQPGYTVEVYDGDELLASAVAGASGLWSVSLPDDMPEGHYELTIRLIDPDGAIFQTSQIAFNLGPVPTATATRAPSNTPTRTPTLTRTPTATATLTPSPVPTDTPVPPTATLTRTPTASPSPTGTPTPTPSPSPTETPVPPTRTPIPPTATDTLTPSATPSETAQPTVAPLQVQGTDAPTATPTVTPSPTVTPLAPPEIAALPAQVSALEPVIIDGRAEPGQTVVVTANGDPVGTVAAGPDGAWTVTWEGGTLGEVTLEAVAVEGDVNASPPAVLRVELVAPRPRITAPAPGSVFSPGPVTVRGIAQPGVTVTLRDRDGGQVLATVIVPADGAWQASVTLAGDGEIALVAEVPGPDGTTLASDPVVVRLAPPVQPQSGGILTDDPDDTGRAFTALLALLLAAGGFSAYFAGRLLYMLAHDRLKTR